AEAAELVRLVAATDPADEAPVGQVIEDRDLLGQAQRLPDRQHERGCCDPQAPGALGDLERLQEGRRRHPVIREVVLGHQDEVVTHLFGVLDLLEALFEQALPAAQRGIGPLVEHPKFHRITPSSWDSSSAIWIRVSAMDIPIPPYYGRSRPLPSASPTSR